MTKKEDVPNSLRPHRIRNDHADLNKVIVMIQKTMNPFDVNLDPDKLYNIGTGLAAMDSTQNVLLNVFKKEGNKRIKIVEECTLNSLRFEKPIKRQKNISFATQTGKQKITVSDGNVLLACLMRDLFGRILYLLLQRKVDMAQLLKHPLTLVPFSLTHVNGTMLSTPKLELLTYIEIKGAMTTPDETDVQIIDAAFLLHLHKNLPANFGVLAKPEENFTKRRKGDSFCF